MAHDPNSSFAAWKVGMRPLAYLQTRVPANSGGHAGAPIVAMEPTSSRRSGSKVVGVLAIIYALIVIIFCVSVVLTNIDEDVRLEGSRSQMMKVGIDAAIVNEAINGQRHISPENERIGNATSLCVCLLQMAAIIGAVGLLLHANWGGWLLLSCNAATFFAEGLAANMLAVFSLILGGITLAFLGVQRAKMQAVCLPIRLF